MKFIRYTRADGGISECHPQPNARLVKADKDGDAVPLFTVAKGVSPELPEGCVYAETEDEFVARIAASDVPSDATDVTIVSA